MNCWTVPAPPAILTFLSPAAAFACCKALSMPSVTKVNVVPPSLTNLSRGWWVTTNTGMRKGGLSPHGPRGSEALAKLLIVFVGLSAAEALHLAEGGQIEHPLLDKHAPIAQGVSCTSVGPRDVSI